ncbi:MAG: hypothetical protein V9G22_13185 [Ottowia sp.]
MPLLLFALLMGAVLVQRFARVAGERPRAGWSRWTSACASAKPNCSSRHAELRQEYAHQAALQERQRLMRDIHDGVGVQLVGLLDLLERDATAARGAARSGGHRAGRAAHGRGRACNPCMAT